MRIAISAENNQGLDSPVSMHFAHAAYFILADVEGQQITRVGAVANPFHGNHMPGQLPAFIHSQGAQVMLAGGMGQRAVDFFRDQGIETATGASGTVRQSLARYLDGNLYGAQPCADGGHQHGCGQ
jgi:predicted Fe-Mo cluster-binding NifX family protein